MIRKNIFANILLLLSACSTESHYDTPVSDIPDNTECREVLLTLNNKLIVKSHSARTIATSEENAISSLDVYVFGAAEENGTYTFQQHFAYRSDDTANNASLPQGAEELQLSAVNDGGQSVTTGLLSLKRGLFVKLYCIANDTTLINPATGKMMKAKDFIPITFNQTNGKTSIANVGVPLEQDFIKFHTTLLGGGKLTDTKGEVLLTPLAMSGAMNTPLDLTDPENSSRLQTRLRLTRLAARFDIVNNAQESRFTIQSVSMGNARRGASILPIVAYGERPAKDGELVTLTERSFNGNNANKGLSTGAFYSYPSPLEDNAYLILKGNYRINETEVKKVSYQIPFRRKASDGTESWLEINNNHRYTIGITRADDYHLDFTLNVADWADDGAVDDYQPENKPGELTVKIPDSFAGDTQDTFDAVRKIHTVSMSLKDGSTFDAFIGSNSPLSVSKTYAGGTEGKKYDWLEISELPITHVAFSTYQYTFSLKEHYISGRYPRCTVRISDSLSGEETILYVEAIAVPQPAATQQPDKAPNGSSTNPNTFDVETQTASLYRITDSHAKVRITCPDGAVLKSKPDWVDVTEESRSGADIIYVMTLNERDTDETAGKVIFGNEKHPELVTDINITLEDASIVPSFAGIGTDNAYTPPANKDELGNVEMKVTDGNTCQVNTTSMDGIAVKIDFAGGPEWLAHDGETASGNKETDSKAARTADLNPNTSGISSRAGDRWDNIIFHLQNDKLAGAKTATITLVNKIGGPDYRFTVTPQLQTGSMEKISSMPADDKIGAGNTLTLYKLPVKASTMDVKVTTYGGSVLTSDNDCVTVTKTATARSSSVSQDDNIAYYTLTANTPGTATLTLANRTDASKKETFTVTVISSEITVPTPAAMTLNTSAVNQTATAKISSPLGFTAEVTDFTNGEGGQSWLRVDTKNMAGGKDVNFTVAVNSLPAILRPTTVTLKNKIKDGGDKVITVSPTYVVPAVSATTRNYNTLTGTNGTATLKLYRYANSYLTVNVKAVGGSMIQNANGVTVTNATGSYNTDNTYTITLNSATTTGGSFKIVNKSDATKVTTVTVNAPASVNTAPATSKNLDVITNKYIDNNANFPEGFTVSVNWNGATANWFTLNNTNFNNGNQTVRATMKNQSGMTIKAATVTLKNKITGGEDKTYTVNPVFQAPTISYANGNVPTQNSMSGTTINLYQVTNSRVQVKASVLGGSYVKNKSSNITVSGGNNNNTDNTYTVTWVSGGDGWFDIANKHDANKTASRITVKALATTITSSNVNLNVATSSTSNITVTTPLDATAKIQNLNGGTQWFDLVSTAIAAGNNKTIQVKTKNDVSTQTIKPVVVRISTNAQGGSNKDITVSPTNFPVPTITRTAGYQLNTLEGTAMVMYSSPSNPSLNSSIELTVVSPGGSTITKPSWLSLTSAASSDATTMKYILKMPYNTASGGSVITIANKSNTAQKQTINLTIKQTGAPLYPTNNEPAIETQSYWVAPINEADYSSFAQAQTLCPAGWRLPSANDINKMHNENFDQLKIAYPQKVASSNHNGTGLYWTDSGTFIHTLVDWSPGYVGGSANWSTRCLRNK